MDRRTGGDPVPARAGPDAPGEAERALSGYGLGWSERPADVLTRNFWFCTLDDPATIGTRERIGVENILFETDYPHGDGTWPASQRLIEEVWGHIPNDEIRMMCSENAAALYRHPLPDVVLPKA